ncbi:hypothetical protein ACFWJT_15800 [Streptomyces sp. NPDC127069]|uniref:hypothetical protein n=1 Tax=Streptomyces sp. NPDC127069 TaxID=3347128 RepID=UPI00365756CB
MPWTVTASSETSTSSTVTVDTEADLHHLIRLLAADPRELSIHVRPAAGSEA